MRRMRGSATLLVLVVSLALVAAACGGGGGNKNKAATNIPQGGDLVLGAEQEPDCADWIASCAGALWGAITMEIQTMPHVYEWSPDNHFKTSILLTGDPKLEPGPPQKVTYDINPKAVWDDGQPITSTDFKYTWDQIAHGSDIYDRTGYQDVASVDDSDPHRAVLTFSKPYANYRELYGGFYGVLPAHLLQGKDRDALMKDGYTFSGWAWKIDHWTKGTEIKIVPNPNWWGPKVHLNSITFKFVPDTAAQVAAYKSGQVVAIWPQAQPFLTEVKTLPDTYFDTKTGLSYEAIWFNVEKFPVNSAKVRQALAYMTDRKGIVDQLFGPLQPGIAPIDSMVTPSFLDAYNNAFSKYSLDLTKANDLMTSDGWTKGADGIWTKGGKKCEVELKTTTGNKRRELTYQILQSQWKQGGCTLNPVPEKAGTFFGQDLPKGNFVSGLYAQTPSDNDPSVAGCPIWCTKSIPTAGNQYSGTNWDRISDPKLDDAFGKVDTLLTQSSRIDAFHDGQNQLAELVPAIPLDPFPDFIVVNSRVVGIDTGQFQHDNAYTYYSQAFHWYKKA